VSSPGIWRALRNFDIPRRTTVDTPSIRVSTSAYDATPKSEIEALGSLTRYESRLLVQGGAKAVREDRMYYHREQCHNMTCTDVKHRGLKGNEGMVTVKPTEPEPVHCGCNIPVSDPERVWYQCSRVSKLEREKRILLRNYVRETHETETPRMVQAPAPEQRTGRPEDKREGTNQGNEGPPITSLDDAVSKLRVPSDQRGKTVTQTATKNKGGRPKGRRDTKPRVRTVRRTK